MRPTPRAPPDAGSIGRPVAERVALGLLLAGVLTARLAWPAYAERTKREAQLARSTFDGSGSIHHEAPRLPRFTSANLTPAAYAAPFILVGLCDGGDRTCPALRRFAGDVPALADAAVTHYGANMDPKSRIRPRPRTPWLTALRSLRHQAALDRAQPLPQVVQWNGMGQAAWAALLDGMPALPPPLARTASWLSALPPPLADELAAATFFRMVVVGNAGSGMFNHRDTLSAGSWQWQVRGRKWWHLCAPSESPAVVADPAGDPRVGADMLFLDAAPEEQRARARRARCYLDAVHPGELVYYPAHYWHQTLNADAVSAALSESVITRAAASELRADLVGLCGGGGSRAGDGLSPELCAALPRAWGVLAEEEGLELWPDGGATGGDHAATAAAVLVGPAASTASALDAPLGRADHDVYGVAG